MTDLLSSLGALSVLRPGWRSLTFLTFWRSAFTLSSTAAGWAVTESIEQGWFGERTLLLRHTEVAAFRSLVRQARQDANVPYWFVE